MIKVGIVGLGFMAATHLKAYRQLGGMRVGALCNPSGHRLDGDFSDISGNLGNTDPIKLDMAFVKPYRVFADLLADPDIQLIDICAPTPAHPELVMAALQAGKHVLCEKPLARTSQQACEIIAVASSARGFFMPAMCMRFWPEWAWLRKNIEEKTFGEVRSACFRRVGQPPTWGRKVYFDGRQSGGALFDLHIHDTDFIQACFGRPQSVYSTGYTKFSGAIDHVVTQYRVASGAVVQAEGSWAMADDFGFKMTYTVNFENATADYDLARGADALKLFVSGQPPRIVHCEGGDGYDGELHHMIHSIQQGTPPTIVTAIDALVAVEICEAEEESIRTGKIVTL
ncbi:MAG: afr 7 [Pedosphaera sp.]|nr:afr 7 [Pedosphaera sp.]